MTNDQHEEYVEAAQREPEPHIVSEWITIHDDDSESLVWEWSDGTRQIRTRPGQWATWLSTLPMRRIGGVSC